MTSIARVHADWLRLIEASGFVSLPVLKRAFPQGLAAHDPEHFAQLREAHEEWEDAQSGDVRDVAAHRRFVRWVLTETLGFTDEMLAEGQRLPAALAVKIPEHGETLRPDCAVLNPSGTPDAGKPRLLIRVYEPGTDPERALRGSRWAASPATRMTELLRGTNVRLGLVTDGERWMLVHTPPNETTGFAMWYASLWFDEKETLRAFRDLLGAARFFGVAAEDALESLLAESAKDQHEVTDQLGLQVRRALEVLIQTIDRINRDRKGELLRDVREKDLYDAGLTVMMRLVFLFAAEERGLLLLGDPLYDAHYAVSTIRDQLREDADQHGEEILERRHAAWSRLLATFRAVHAGVDHDVLRIPAYGGTLFDPDRFPFLEGRGLGTNWKETPADPLPIDDRTVLHLLDALQILQVKIGGGPPEAQRVSFRALDIEQIGHVYEGLLDHTAKRAAAPVLGLRGTAKLEPEVSLADLETQRSKGAAALVEFVCEATGRSAKAVEKAVAYDLLGVDDQKFMVACDNDNALFQRVKPFAGFVREDTKGLPVVIPEGSVYVTEGTDRRSTGTHYTPRSLTEPVVQYTLEPLVYDGPAEGKPKEEWKLRAPADLLGLRVCDLAMGSGAFLVQACRYLSERLVEAWEVAEQAAPGSVHALPGAELAAGAPSERVLPRDKDERLGLARRYVADQCLYGVDINPMAVEMAKLSLWLTTLQKGRPFTFLDHALKCGDSLLGVTSSEQIEHFHIDPARGRTLHRGALPYRNVCAPALARAIEKRRRLESFTVNDIRDAEEKARLLRDADEALGIVRLMCDLLVGASLRTSGTASDLDTRLVSTLDKLSIALVRPVGDPTRENWIADLHRVALEELATGLTPPEQRRSFHWSVEFPEVFLRQGGEESRGFDAIVGNPPFMGGQKITGNLTTAYRDYLVAHLANGRRGSVDLCAYFLLRAFSLLNPRGGLATLATNTIAQGDTREVGLERIVELGGSIQRAVQSRPWPGTAALEIAEVWVRRRPWIGECVLDDVPVSSITPFLARPGRIEGNPHRLEVNAGKSFQGSIVLGMGFVLEPEDARALIARDSRNRDVLFPYLNGDDLNSRPDCSASRWVINFHDWPLDRGSAPNGYAGPVAADYPECLEILREHVKPERDRNKMKGRRERWWQYGARATELYTTIASMRRVLVVSAIAKHHAFAFVGHRFVFDHNLVVIASERPEMLAMLQSSIHLSWSTFRSSGLETRPGYRHTDGFENFPFPVSMGELAPLGDELDVSRLATMRRLGIGLRDLYNDFHDPANSDAAFADLRGLQTRIDVAVAKQYGWTDVGLGHGFHETRLGTRFTISEAARYEILDRLLELNGKRHANESPQGALRKKGTAKHPGLGARARSLPPDLFGDGFGGQADV